MMMLMMVVVRGDADVDDGDDTYIQLASITRSIIGSCYTRSKAHITWV